MSEKFLDKEELACQSEDCDEGVSAVAPSNNPPARGANFTEMVETLEENEDIVECKECFELVPKKDCTKGEHGYICPTCGGKIEDEDEAIKIENGFDYYESEFPEVATYDDEFSDTVKETQDRFEFDTDFADFGEEYEEIPMEEISPEIEDTEKKTTLNEFVYASDDVAISSDGDKYDPTVLHTWTCIFDDKEIGEVKAYTEDEAYMEMERQFPEYHYGEYDGVALVALNENAESVDTLTEAEGDGAAYNTSRTVSALADKAASWARLKVGGDNSIIDYFFGDMSLFRAIDEEAGKAKGNGFSVVAIAEGFARGGAAGEAVTNANAAIAKANKSGKGNSFGKIDEAIAVAKAVSTRHTEVIITITVESFSTELQNKIKAEYPKLLTAIKGKSSSFVRGGSTTPPILEFSKGKSTPKTIDLSLRNTLRDIKEDIEQNFTYEDFALTGDSGDKDPEEDPKKEDPKSTGKGWTCECGEENDPDDKVCGECGKKKPVEKPATSGDSWECPDCGKKNTKKFCSECGTKKPEAAPTPSADAAKVRQLKNKLNDAIDAATERLEDENPEEDGLRDKYFDRSVKHLNKLSDRVDAAETVEELEELNIEAAINNLFDALSKIEGRGTKPEDPAKEEETPEEEKTPEEETSEEETPEEGEGTEESGEEETPEESEEEPEDVGFTGKLSELTDVQLAKLYSAVTGQGVGYADKEKTKLADKWHKTMNKLKRNLHELGESFDSEEDLKASIKEVLTTTSFEEDFENEIDEYHADQQFIEADAWEDAWADDWSETADQELVADEPEVEAKEETVECNWCLKEVPKSICREEVDLGWLCDHCEETIKSDGQTLTFIEN